VSRGARRSVIALGVTLTAVGSLLALAARGAGPLPGDLALTRWLQDWLPPDDLAGSLLPYTSRIVWFLAVAFLAVSLLRRQWLSALFVFVAGVTGLLVGDALKPLVARARPSAELVRVYDLSEGYSFPSTTALLSVVLLGMICYLAGRERPWRPFVVVVLCIWLLLVLASGISRIYVGEHWATDVLGGWLFGGAWLLILIAIHRWWTSRQARPSVPQKAR
jgi:membrane-associated phospholipid phosphatase